MKDLNDNRSGYKKTNEGWIPEEWEIVTLAEIIKEKRLGANYENNEWEKGLPLIKMGNIGRGKIKLDKIERVPPSLVYEKEYILQKGDVLFNTRNTLDLVGKVAIWADELPLALYNSNLLKIKFKESKINSPIFANYLLNSQESLRRLRGLAIGTTSVAAIYDRDLIRLKVTIPSIHEQKKIAEILSTWDDAIEQTRKLIEAKKRQIKALMQQLLTGKRLNRSNEHDWNVKPFGDLIKSISRPVSKPQSPYLSIGIRSHGKGTFQKVVEQPEKVMMDTLYRVEANDLIVNITFAWEGAIAIASERDSGGLVSHRFPTYRISETEADIDFLRYVILTKRFVWDLGLISPGGAGRNRVLSQKDFLKMKVVAPLVETQKEIGKTLAAEDKELHLWEDYLKAIEKQKRGLMQKLLTGEVRVKL